MGWEEYIESDEKIISTFNHKKIRWLWITNTTIGVTEKRAFLYVNRKNTENYISTKKPIHTIDYRQRRIRLIGWILLGVLIAFGVYNGVLRLIPHEILNPEYPNDSGEQYIMENPSNMDILIGLLYILVPSGILLICILFRQRTVLSCYIGDTFVELSSRKEMNRIKVIEFIKILHSQDPISREISDSKAGSKLLTTKKGKGIIGIIMVLLILYVLNIIGYI